MGPNTCLSHRGSSAGCDYVSRTTELATCTFAPMVSPPAVEDREGPDPRVVSDRFSKAAANYHRVVLGFTSF